MHQELEQKLLEDFPALYQDEGELTMAFGFECADGWFHIIYDLSSDIMKLAEEDGIATPKVAQVKEKFGALRCYLMGIGNEHIQQRISQAEELSLNTCEICGDAGKLRQGGWVRTLCEEHADKGGSAS